MSERIAEDIAEAGEKRLVQTFEGEAMADMERMDNGIPKDMIIPPISSAAEAQEIAASADVPDADPLEGERSLEPVASDKQVDDADSDETGPDTLEKEGLEPEEIAVVTAKSPEAVEQARRNFKIPRHPDDEEDATAARKSKSPVFSDAPEDEAGFVGREDRRGNSDKPDNRTAGFEADGAGGMAGPGALGAAGAGGLLSAGGPAGGFNAASGTGGGGFEPGGGDGGAFGWNFRQDWLKLRRPMEYRPLTKRLDKVIATVLADETRDTNIVYMNVGWRNKSNNISKTITQLVDARARYLATHPDEAAKAMGLAKGSPTLLKLGELKFTDDRVEADNLRHLYRSRAAAAASAASP